MPQAGKPRASLPSSDWAEDIEEESLEARAVARARKVRPVLQTTGLLMNESETAAAALVSRRATGMVTLNAQMYAQGKTLPEKHNRARAPTSTPERKSPSAGRAVRMPRSIE